MKFSIITASFEPGRKLIQTVENILDQTFDDYEVIIKDGGSRDGSIEEMMKVPRIRAAVEAGKVLVHVQEDKNVYDGMNQAFSLCQGDYLLFLNCGDFFHDAQVLEHVAEWIEKGLKKQSAEEQVKQQKENEVKQEKESKEGWKNRNAIPAIYYGNTFCSRTGAMVHSAPSISGFTCYRNIPCHQSCFYDRRLFEEKQYDISLKVRADYDHFLWCFYVKKASFQYMDIIISDYEGGGISEVKENRRLDQEEHKLVTKRYMSSGKLLKYKTIMLLTLAPLRRKLAEDSALSGVYHRFKNIIYGK